MRIKGRILLILYKIQESLALFGAVSSVLLIPRASHGNTRIYNTIILKYEKG